MNKLWKNLSREIYTVGDIGLHGNQGCGSQSTLNLTFSKYWRQKTNEHKLKI